MNADQIKLALTSHLLRSGRSASTTGFLEELKVRGGQVWADLVDVPDMHCYEIKSERDSLKRLIGQGTQYACVFDHVTLVAAERHLKKALPILPNWWGVMVVPDSPVGEFKQLRAASRNTLHEPEMLVTLLDHAECLEILSDLDPARGWKSKSLYQLQGRIAGLVSVTRLKCIVRDSLARRAAARNEPVAH